MTNLETFADAEAALAATLPNYEQRSPQQAFARAVEGIYAGVDAPGDQVHLMAQAGCGVGKSLGYLIPAILSGYRTVVSVTTRALQSQLADKDMPFLEANLPVRFTWAMLQGQANYLCLNRCAMTDTTEVPQLAEIMRLGNQPGFGGTKDDLGLTIPWQDWNLICCDSEECEDVCSAQTGCYVKAAREQALNADVLIVNHALFFLDLVMKGGSGDSNRGDGMIGAYDVVVFDEAAELESYAAAALGGQITLGAITNATGEVRSWISQFADETNILAGVERAVVDTMGSATALFPRLADGKLTAQVILDLEQDLGGLHKSLMDLFNTFSGLTYRALMGTKNGEYAARRKASVSKKVRSLMESVTALIMADPLETVCWVESRQGGRGNNQLIRTIKMSPIEIGPFMRDRLLRYNPCVFVSATLSPGGSFGYMAGRFGLERDTYVSLDVGSPFDFPTQARLYVPKNLPEPNASNWQTEANEEIVDLLRVSKGRALVLFTSIAHMKAAHASIKRRVPFEVKMQGEEPNGALVAWLKTSESGVIFATRSFFTGVDIQGSALSLVILTKIPFPVPTEPLFKARCEAIEARGGNSFSGMSVPETSLVMQQAVGRLIRHRDDFGMVAILDPRMVSKGYGRTLLRDLPPMPRAETVQEMQDWFEGRSALISA